MNTVLIKNTRQHWKGKKGNRGLSWSIKVDIPGLDGCLDCKVLGEIMAAEMVDAMKTNLRKGLTVNGKTPNTKFNITKLRCRAVNRSLLLGAPLTGNFRKLTAWVKNALTPTGNTKSERRDWIKERAKIIQNYMRVRRYGRINGIRQPQQTIRHLPSITSNLSVDDSHLMVDALSARYSKSRSGTNKNTGKRWAIASQIMISTAKKRQKPLNFVGGMNTFSANSYIRNNRTKFTRTYKLWNNAVTFRDISSPRYVIFMAVIKMTYVIMRRFA